MFSYCRRRLFCVETKKKLFSRSRASLYSSSLGCLCLWNLFHYTRSRRRLVGQWRQIGDISTPHTHCDETPIYYCFYCRWAFARAHAKLLFTRWTESPAESHRSLLGAHCSLIASNWSVICSSWRWFYVRRTNQFDCHSLVVFLNFDSISAKNCDGNDNGKRLFVICSFSSRRCFSHIHRSSQRQRHPFPPPLPFGCREPLRLVSWFTRSTRPIEFFECDDFSSSEKIEKFLKPIPITHLLVMILLV